MDTCFWGPDGWKLSHSIVHMFPNNPSNDDKLYYYLFFESFKYILPCIYCRRSFSEYTQKHPIINCLKNKDSLTKWLYDIHNMVNDKLRKQGYNTKQDPSYDNICQYYDNYINDINYNDCINMPGWDFLYCIFYNYPDDVNEPKKLPKDYSVVERHPHYIIFLNSLIYVLPFKKVKNILNKYSLDKLIINKKDDFMKLIHDLEKCVSSYINKKCMSYDDRCEYIDKYKVKCTD